MGRQLEAARTTLASQRKSATSVLNQSNRLGNEFAQLDADNRQTVRRSLGYPNTIRGRAHPVRWSIRVGGPAKGRVVRPPWYRRRWAKFIATEAAKWAGGKIIEGLMKFSVRRQAPSPIW